MLTNPFYWTCSICLPESYVLDFLRSSILEPDPLHPPLSGHTWHKGVVGIIQRPLFFWEITEFLPNQREKIKSKPPLPGVQQHGRLPMNALVRNLPPKAGNRIRDVYVCGNELSLLRLRRVGSLAQVTTTEKGPAWSAFKPSDWPTTSEFPECFRWVILHRYHWNK